MKKSTFVTIRSEGDFIICLPDVTEHDDVFPLKIYIILSSHFEQMQRAPTHTTKISEAMSAISQLQIMVVLKKAVRE